MLAARVGRRNTDPEDKPCTLHLPQMSRQIFRRKLIVIELCSMKDAVHQDQGEAKCHNSEGNTDQHEIGADEFERRSLPGAVLPVQSARCCERMRLALDPVSPEIQKSHSEPHSSPGA